MSAETRGTFGPLLRRLRQRADFGLRELSEAVGVSLIYLSDVERGARPPLSTERIMFVASALEISPGDLLLAAAADEGELRLPCDEHSGEIVREWLRLHAGEHVSAAQQLAAALCREGPTPPLPAIVEEAVRELADADCARAALEAVVEPDGSLAVMAARAAAFFARR